MLHIYTMYIYIWSQIHGQIGAQDEPLMTAGSCRTGAARRMTGCGKRRNSAAANVLFNGYFVGTSLR